MGPAQGQDGAVRSCCNGVNMSRLLQVPCACKVPGTSNGFCVKETGRVQLKDTQILDSTGLLHMQHVICTIVHEVPVYACGLVNIYTSVYLLVPPDV